MHVGIVGAGQLGRMLALSGYPIGVRCLFLDRGADTPGAQVAESLIGDLEDPALLAELAARSDVVTFDWENIAGRALEPLEQITQVRPPRARNAAGHRQGARRHCATVPNGAVQTVSRWAAR